MNASRSAFRHRGWSAGCDRSATGAVRPRRNEPCIVRAGTRGDARLRRLPRRQCEVLVLRYFADLSEREIAETLGVTSAP